MVTTLTKKRKRVRLTADEMVAVVNEILSRGHDVEIRRGRGNTYIIIEVVKTTYRAGGQ